MKFTVKFGPPGGRIGHPLGRGLIAALPPPLHTTPCRKDPCRHIAYIRRLMYVLFVI